MVLVYQGLKMIFRNVEYGLKCFCKMFFNFKNDFKNNSLNVFYTVLYNPYIFCKKGNLVLIDFF